MDHPDLYSVCYEFQKQNRIVMENAESDKCVLKDELERLKALLLQRDRQIQILQAENFRIRNACLASLYEKLKFTS